MNASSTAMLDAKTLDIVHTEFADTLPPLHRIRTVRREQGVNLIQLMRKTGVSLYDLKREELERSDILLSRLYWWQRMLDVPVADLLIEPAAGLSPMIMQRARMVRVMKTAAAIKEEAKSHSERGLAETLVNQLLEMMPDLEGVRSWNSVGQRRTLDELGRIAERTVSVRDLKAE